MTAWMDNAACRGHDPEMWFPHPSDHIGIELARAVCDRCPVKADCGRWADEIGAVGVWGGRFRAEPEKPLSTLASVPHDVMLRRLAALIDAYDESGEGVYVRAGQAFGLRRSSMWLVAQWAHARGWWEIGHKGNNGAGYPTRTGREAADLVRVTA